MAPTLDLERLPPTLDLERLPAPTPTLIPTPTPDLERLSDPEKDSAAKTQRKTTSVFEAKMRGPGPRGKPPRIVCEVNMDNTYVLSEAMRKKIREFKVRKVHERKEGATRWLCARPDLVKKKPVDKTGHLGDPEEEKKMAD